MEAVGLSGNATGRAAFVVLGASNVSRGLARLVTAARARSPAPLDLFVAAGHGRGYGVNTRVAWRRLPSIAGSGLWGALERERIEAPAALVTDVGNELLYGFTADQVACWVRESVRRLADRDARLAIVRLPLSTIAGVGSFRYRALRTFFVPGCRLSLAELRDAAARLDAALVAIADECGGRIVEQPAAWYGLDALHVRRRRLDDLWHAVCDAWQLPAVAARPRATFRDWMTVGTKAAEVRSLGRVLRHTPQPVVHRDDLRLWLY